MDSDLCIGLAPAVLPELVRTQLFGPVSALSSVNCAQNGVSRRCEIRHFRQGLRTSILLLGRKGLRFLVLSGALAAETFQNYGFSGEAAEKDMASDCQNAPGPAGSGANCESALWLVCGTHFRKLICFLLCESRRRGPFLLI